MRKAKIKDWKSLQIGERLLFSWDEFDGAGSIECFVSEKHDDHLIVKAADGQEMWLDDIFADMYQRLPE